MNRASLTLATLAPSLALAACATLPPRIPEAAACRANYLGLDERVESAGVRDGGARQVPGFPYLRVNRFLASFRDAARDGAPLDAWVGRMRALDLAARAAELRNLGWSDPAEELAHLDRCGEDWAARDLADPARRAQLRQAAQVPDDYSRLRRIVGLYALAVPFLNWGIADFNDEVREDYATPLAQLESPGPLVLWSPGSDPRADGAGSGAGASAADRAATLVAGAARDALGIPRLDSAEWRVLAQAHAPHWQVETAGEFDRIGAPVPGDGKPGLDAARPLVYFKGAHTRFGDEVLLQLAYVAWFSERPKDGLIDPYSGALGGVVWRVTLDRAGRPLLYDTIHPCGCYHYYFTAQPLRRKAQGSFWDEPVLFPQEQAPAPPFAIRVQSGTHYVRRLVPLADARAAETRSYGIADYHELLTLPDGRGGTRSLFHSDGLVPGTERLERTWLWMAGIKSPGAMRQWGRHATSFVGRSHFDEPFLLDRLFEKNQVRSIFPGAAEK